jgi:hypothetical protein
MPRDLTNGMSVRSKKRDDRFANQDTLVTNPFFVARLWLCGGREAIQFFRVSFLSCEFEIVVAGHPI